MATKKQQSNKKKLRSNKRQQRYKTRKFFIGGTCAMCGSCTNQNAIPNSLFRGGKNCIWKNRRGGNDNPPSFNGQLPQRYYYSQNTLNNDPTMAQIDTRQLPIKGGKRCTQKKSKRGGAFGTYFFNGQMGSDMTFNPINSIGEIASSSIGSNYISGNINPTILPNPSVFSQPVETKYNMYNMPMA